MKVPFVDLGQQHLLLKEEINQRLQEVVSCDAFILGDQVVQFEQEFAEYCSVRYAIGVNSGTDALILALKTLGLGPGDEVIAPANTFVATVEAIVHAGCTPRLVDALPGTYNMDPHQVEEAITPATKGIIVVHLYGQPADLDAITKIGRSCGLVVIEDAAQAHGARYKGRRIGSLGDVACFSFYPSKNLGAWGDAGAIVTNDEELTNTARKLRDHGATHKYQHDLVGFNSRLDTIQAAVLSVKLRYLDEWNEERRTYAAVYDELLADLPWVTTPQVLLEVKAVYHLYVVHLQGVDRSRLQSYLEDRGVGTGIHYPRPVHLTPAFEYLCYQRGAFPVAESYAETVLSLPMYPGLRREQQEYVVQQMQAFSKECS